MAHSLTDIYEKFKSIKEYLTKLGPSRRTQNIIEKKLNESNTIYNDFLTVKSDLEKQIKKEEFTSSDLNTIQNLCTDISGLYARIKQLCSSVTQKKIVKMEKFQLRTAVALLPVMNSDEEITKGLISAIELYSSMIEKDDEQLLVNFVLKTRLSESAKLRLQQSYSSCDELLKEMRLHLLTKKSSNAVHAEMVNCEQKLSSIDEFGKKMEQLFVDLTISQADGDTKAFDVLKPINEKLAINRFINGLRNKNLCVILAARNYTTLKDVIRAAKDEEQISSKGVANSTEGEMMVVSNEKSGESNTQSRFFRNSSNYRGRGAQGNYQRAPRGYFNHGWQRSSSNNNNRGRGTYRGQRGRYQNRDECLTYLRNQAAEMGLSVQVHEPLPKKPILIMTWEGLEPTLPSVLLNSHMDVVPVFEKSWTHPPFEAHLKDGIIYGRGVQDMKSVAIQYIEAVKRIKAKGIRLKRTLHLSFVPDEEIGGGPGMGEFVKTDAFKNLNVGFAMDEGIASATEDFLIFNGERTIWHMKIICPGKSGHGSLLLPDNSGEKLRYIIDKFMDLRKESKKKLADNPNLNIGDVTTVNLTMLSGGIQNNVVPEKLTASFDIRIALSVDQKEFESEIRRWCVEAGDGVTFEYEQKDPYVAPTKLDDSNAYWLAFKAAAEQLKIPLKTCTFPGGTDSRYLRELGIPALGFSPMSKTTPGLHEHDESLRADVFLRGIGIYEAVVPAVANV